MIFVAGLSKTGKTTLIQRRLSDHPNKWIPISGSEILKGMGRPTKDLSRVQALTNQKLISYWLHQLPYVDGSHVIFDGHLLIETYEEPILIPLDTFDGTLLQAVLFIDAGFDVIAKRREKPDLNSTELEIKHLMDLERASAKPLASRHNSPFYTVNSNYYPDFENIMTHQI